MIFTFLNQPLSEWLDWQIFGRNPLYTLSHTLSLTHKQTHITHTYTLSVHDSVCYLSTCVLVLNLLCCTLLPSHLCHLVTEAHTPPHLLLLFIILFFFVCIFYVFLVLFCFHTHVCLSRSQLQWLTSKAKANIKMWHITHSLMSWHKLSKIESNVTLMSWLTSISLWMPWDVS